jgi:hypothetical protein
MTVISVIEDQDVIKKILKHLGLWEVKPRPPPRMVRHSPYTPSPILIISTRILDSSVASKEDRKSNPLKKCSQK